MPIATDSGYLPDWLQALLGQGQIGPSNAPAGLFSETAASPAPNVGLLANLPQFTGVNLGAPASQGGNAPNGPLPDQSPTFNYMSSTPPWGGSGPSNSYPSMTIPQDPGPMNIGPGGADPSFTGVSPNAPFTANGTSQIQDPYVNVPLPPRRPNDPTSFHAQADPQDINAPPPGQPNANVIGTQASGAPEITAQQSLGLGDYLGKASNLIGSIYGAGGPGDALIALGLSNRTNGASIQALNAMNANRTNDVKLQLLKNQLSLQAQQQNYTYNYLRGKGLSDADAKAATFDPALASKYFTQFAGSTKNQLATDPSTGDVVAYDPYNPSDRTTMFKGGPPKPEVIGEDPNTGQKSYGIKTPNGWVRTDENGKPVDSQGEDVVSKAARNLPPVDTSKIPEPGSPAAREIKARGEAFLKTLPEGMANQVRAVAEGREAYPAAGNRSANAQAIMRAVNTYDPFFDKTSTDARNKTRNQFADNGPSGVGGAITAGNTGLQHLKAWSDWAEELSKTNTSSPLFNQLKNTASINLGRGLPAMNADTVAGLVSEELTRFYRGAGGNESDIQRLIDKLKSSGSPDQLKSTAATLTDLVQSKTKSYQRQWRAGMGPLAEDYPVIQPEGRAAINTIMDRVKDVQGGVPGSRSKDPQSVSDDPLDKARAALAAGVPRTLVMQRLLNSGIDPKGL